MVVSAMREITMVMRWRVTGGMYVWTTKSGKASLSASVWSWRLNVKNMPTIQRWGGNEEGQMGISGIYQDLLEMWTQELLESVKKHYPQPENKSKSVTVSPFNAILNHYLIGPSKDDIISYKNLPLSVSAIYYLLLTIEGSDSVKWYVLNLYMMQWFPSGVKMTLRFMVYCP